MVGTRAAVGPVADAARRTCPPSPVKRRYEVPGAAFDLACRHLARHRAVHPRRLPAGRSHHDPRYALHVRAIAGDRDPTRASTALYRQGGIALQLDAAAWLWPVIDDPEIRAEIERLFLDAAVETAGAATSATSYSEDAYVIAVSDRRTDGIVLDALVSEAPSSDLIPKVVTGLLASQRRGHWNSAEDNVLILVALKHYFEQFEGVTPEFVARAWLGDTYVAEQTFSGRTTDRATSVVPMGEVTGIADGTPLVLQKDGLGRSYYRLGSRYAPADLSLDPRDEGFVVERTYEAIDEPSDVQRDADGAWRIRAGAPVRVDRHDGRRRPSHPRRPDRPAPRRAGADQPGARCVADVRPRGSRRRRIRRRRLGP